MLAPTGEVLTSLDLGADIVSISSQGDTVVVTTEDEQLHVVELSTTGGLELLGSIEVPSFDGDSSPAGNVFLADGIAYVSNGESSIFTTDEAGGFATFDISDPTTPVLLSGPDVPPDNVSTNLQTITNGSGLILVAAGDDGVQVQNGADPANTFDLLSVFDTPGQALAIAVASGIAFVADGAGGLQVVSFAPFDVNGVAPTLEVVVNVDDLDPETDGIQIEEGSFISLDAIITDDVQVRNVTVSVNGEVVLSDVSAPFDLGFPAPLIADVGETAEITVEVFDTGGNSTTEVLTFDLIPDEVAPELVSISLENGAAVAPQTANLSIFFSEPIDPASITADNIIVTVAETGEVVDIGIASVLANGLIASASFANAPFGSLVITVDPTGITDIVGNAIEATPQVLNVELAEFTSLFIGDSGDNFADAENFADGELPDITDIVSIGLGADEEVIFSTVSTIDVGGIITAADFNLVFGTLETSFIDLLGDAELILSGNSFSVLEGATVNGDTVFEGGSGGSSFATLTDVVANGDITFSPQTDNAPTLLNLNVSEGLELNGTLTLIGDVASQSNDASVDFLGGQLISGVGEILLDRAATLGADEFADNNIFFDGLISDVTEVLTFGEDILIRGDGEFSVVNSFSNDDFIQILGSVQSIENGILELGNLNNFGETLTVLDGPGFVVIGDAQNIVLDGPGTFDFASDGLFAPFDTELFNAVIEGSAANGRLGNSIIDFGSNLTINGELLLTDSGGGTASLSSSGVFTTAPNNAVIDGTGRIILDDSDFDRGNLFSVDDARIDFDGTTTSNFDSSGETLTIGAGITIEGSGKIGASSTSDFVQILGTIETDVGDLLVIERLNNQGETVTIVGDGNVVINDGAQDTVFDIVSGNIEFGNGDLSNLIINGDALIQREFGTGVNISDGLTLNGTFLIDSFATSSGDLVDFDRSQVIDGNGEIILDNEDLGAPTVSFTNDGTTENALIETGENITFSGSGQITIDPDTILDLNGVLRSDGLIEVFTGFTSATPGFIDLDDATIGGGFGEIEFSGLSATLILAETSTVLVAIDPTLGNSTFVAPEGDLGGATLELTFTDNAAFTLGQTFTFLTDSSGANGTDITGDFGDFVNFDLAGDLAFAVVEEFVNGDERIISLEVVTDAEAIAGGFIGQATAAAVQTSGLDNSDLFGLRDAFTASTNEASLALASTSDVDASDIFETLEAHALVGDALASTSDVDASDIFETLETHALVGDALASTSDVDVSDIFETLEAHALVGDALAAPLAVVATSQVEQFGGLDFLTQTSPVEAEGLNGSGFVAGFDAAGLLHLDEFILEDAIVEFAA